MFRTKAKLAWSFNIGQDFVVIANKQFTNGSSDHMVLQNAHEYSIGRVDEP